MAYPQDSQFTSATIADMSSTGDKVTLTPAVPVEIVSFGVICTTVFVAAASLVFKCDKRVTAGSDTGRTDGTLGTLTATATQAAISPGSLIRSRPDGLSSAFAGPAPAAANMVVLPGEQAILELTTGITSGAGIGFIEYRALPRLDRASSIEVQVTS